MNIFYSTILDHTILRRLMIEMKDQQIKKNDGKEVTIFNF